MLVSIELARSRLRSAAVGVGRGGAKRATQGVLSALRFDLARCGHSDTMAIIVSIYMYNCVQSGQTGHKQQSRLSTRAIGASGGC